MLAGLFLLGMPKLPFGSPRFNRTANCCCHTTFNTGILALFGQLFDNFVQLKHSPFLMFFECFFSKREGAFNVPGVSPFTVEHSKERTIDCEHLFVTVSGVQKVGIGNVDLLDFGL